MFTVYTNWVACGARKRRACISAPSAELAEQARAEYDRRTVGKVSVDDRIERALHLHRAFNAQYVHEYDPE